jgi:GNAT superfamily N-acetyltransferase
MLRVRPATPEDVPTLGALTRAMGGRTDFAGHMARPECDLLVAVLGGAAAGWCLYNRAPKYRPFRALGIPEVQDLTTAPAYRRRGVASALLAHCEGLARAQGRAHIGIGVGLHASYGPAHILYARRGYIPDGAGVVYDCAPVPFAALRPADDDLCLMLVKALNLSAE